MFNELKGVGVALITPFNDNGELDFNGLKSLLSHVSSFVDYFVVCGTTGEAATLSLKETTQVLNFVIDNNPSKLPIVFGMGGNNTQSVLDNITNIPTGVTAILSASPAYNKPSQAGIIKHFEIIADRSHLPILLYNVPGRTASNLTSETTIALSRHSNIIGIKEASGDIVQAMYIKKDKPEDFLLISGDDLLTPALLAIGASGVISVLANAFPSHFQYLKSGGSERFLELLDINSLMYEESNPVGIKEVLNQMNICGNQVRLPLLKASKALSDKIQKEIASISS